MTTLDSKRLSPSMRVRHLDHLVLTVHDIEATIDFYSLVLGMKEERFANNRIALKLGNQKISLYEYGKEFEPKAQKTTPESSDLYFMTKIPIERAIEHVKKCGLEIQQGPVEHTRAKTRQISFYFRDPDQNLIEVANQLYNS